MRKKMVLKFHWIWLLLISISLLSGQSQKVLFASEYGNRMHSNFLKTNNLDSIIIFYQNEFVKDDALCFDQQLLSKSIRQKFPQENAVGYAVLDWEGEAMNILLGAKIVSNEKYNQVVNNYLRSLEYAQLLRPNVKWGFYNFPPVMYGKMPYNYDEAVKSKWLRILQKVDFLTPSLYILEDQTEVSDNVSYQYAYDNTKYAIKLGKELNKPVYPFIWHRYSDSSKRSGFSLIEPEHFSRFIATILSTSHLGNKVDGLIWWECENYVYNNQSNISTLKDRYPVSINKVLYQEQLLENYYNKIKESVRNSLK